MTTFYLRFNLVLLTLLSLPSVAAARIVISEVLADPPEGSGGRYQPRWAVRPT